MSNTSTLSPIFPSNNSKAEDWLNLLENQELIREIEAEMESVTFSPDKSVINRALAYSRSYSHTSSDIIKEGFGIALN